MSAKTKKQLADDNLRWVREELERRKQAKRAAARHSQPIDGLSPIRVPSLADGLDEIQPPSTRAAGGDA